MSLGFLSEIRRKHSNKYYIIYGMWFSKRIAHFDGRYDVQIFTMSHSTDCLWLKIGNTEPVFIMIIGLKGYFHSTL